MTAREPTEVAFFEGAPIGYYRTTPDGRILFANPALVRMLGYDSFAELERRNLEQEGYEPGYERSKFRSAMEQHGTVRGLVSSWTRKDGRNIFVRETAWAVRDADGRTLHYQGTVEDVTDLRRDHVLDAGVEPFYAVLEHLLEGCQIIGYDWRYVYVNSTVAEQGKRRPEELVGRTMMEMYPGIEQTPLFEVMRRCMSERKPERLLNRFTFPDGSVGWFDLSIEPVPEGIFILSVDVTERQRAQESLQTQLAHLAALREIDVAISSSFDLGFTLSFILDRVRRELAVDAADVLLLKADTQQLEFAAGHGFRSVAAFRGLALPVGGSMAGAAVRQGRPMYFPQITDSAGIVLRAAELEQEGFVSYFGVPLISKGISIGVLEVLHRSRLDPDNDWLRFLEALGGQAAIAIDSARLFENLQRSNVDLVRAYDSAIEGWVAALDLRDKETEGHTRRVAELTLRLAEFVGVAPDELVHIRRGALLHDIGKVGVPDEILHKPGPLTEEEWMVMRRHPQLAYDMLSRMPYLQPALAIPYSHHEKWDGSGYPRGLKAEQIPLPARIFSVVDVWDALTSDRPYRPAWTREQALDYVRTEDGRHFDPAIVKAFFRANLV